MSSSQRLYPRLDLESKAKMHSPGSERRAERMYQSPGHAADDSDSEEYSLSDEYNDENCGSSDENIHDNEMENSTLNTSDRRRMDELNASRDRGNKSLQTSINESPSSSTTRSSERLGKDNRNYRLEDSPDVKYRYSGKTNRSTRTGNVSGHSDLETSRRQVDHSDSNDSATTRKRKQLHSPTRSGEARSYVEVVSTTDSNRPQDRLTEPSVSSLGRRPLCADSTRRIKQIESFTKVEYKPEANASWAKKQDNKAKLARSYFSSDCLVSMLVLISIGIGIFVIGFIYLPTSPKHEPVEPQSSKYEMFRSSLQKLQFNFPSQSQKFWKSIRVGTRPILEQENPSSPSVFIFVANTESSLATTQCLAHKLALEVTKAFDGAPLIEINENLPGSPAEVKIAIDEKIESGLIRGSHAVVINRIEKLHGESAMMFHGYCDNENAQFTRVVYIFTLLATEDIRGGNAEQEGDRFVERVLGTRWRDHLKKDMLEPLLGRIGNANVFINPESEGILSASGCNK